MKQIAKVTIALGLSEVIAVGLRLINVKYLAVFLGPSGVGVFNQIISLYSWLVLLVSLGIEQGLIKYISEYNALGKYEEINRIAVTSFFTFLIFSLLISVSALVFAEGLSTFLLGSPQYKNLCMFMLFAIPPTVLAFVPMGIIKGFRQIKQLSIYKIFDGVLNISILLPMVYLFSLKGAVINLALLALAQLCVVFYLYYKYVPVKISWKQVSVAFFDIKSIFNVLNYGVLNLVINLFNLLMTTILFRRLIITYLGVEQNGIYSPAYGLSTQSMLLLATTLTVYSFTKISEARNNDEIANEVNQLVRISLLLMVPVLFTMICYRSYIVLLLYTKEFLPVADIMPIQFIADFFKVILIAVALPLYAKAKFKAMFISNVSMSLIVYLAGYFLIPRFGLYGAALSYLIMFIGYAILVFPYVIKIFDFKFSKDNYVLMGLSFLLLIVAAILKLSIPFLIPVTIGMLISWLLIVLSPKEKKYLNEKINSLLAKDKA